jgi:hypothetical protein
MASNWQFLVNQTPATSAVAVYDLISTLITAGWKKVSDSDGTTYSSSGTQVTSGASGTNGLGNSKAWVHMQDPAGVREYTFQNAVSNNQNWRVCYSYAAKFTGGSPSATQCPNASDEYILIGGGTEASPTFSEWFNGTEGAYRFGAVADANPFPIVIGSTTYNIYRFWTYGFPNGGGSASGMSHGFAVDPMDPVLNSNTWEYEADPLVHYTGVGSGNPWQSQLAGSTALKSNVFMASGVPTQIGHNTNYLSSFTPGNNFGVGPKTGKDFGGIPLLYGASNSLNPAWPKGWGSLIKLHMTGNSANPRSIANTLTVSSAGDTILMGAAELPWNASTPIV